MSEDMLGPMCLIKERKILCCLKDACLPALTKPPLMSPPPPPRSGGRALQHKGGSLYLKASSDIMEKADSLSGVGERQRDYCCSLIIHRFIFFPFSEKWFILSLHSFGIHSVFSSLTRYINSS